MSSTDQLLDIQVREWELEPNSTVFDHLKAAPSDDVLQIQWILYMSILSVALLFMSFVFFSMLMDKKCRKNSFNSYLLFLMAPDLIFTGSCIITCSLNMLNGSFFSEASCHYQSFYCVFAITSSSFLNAVLAWQLHKMLYCSQKAVRYYPPTRFRVAVHSLSVYAWSAFVASWTAWEAEWWPIRDGLYNGVLCLPMPYDQTSVIFFYTVFAPSVFLIPFLFICYLSFDILRKRLLPPLRQRKTLMIFFRLVLVYFFFWLPAIIMVFVFSNWLSSWWSFFGSVWGHVQGAASAAVCLVKPDIWNACKSTCFSVGSKSDNALENNDRNTERNDVDEIRPPSFLGIHEGDDDEEIMEQGESATTAGGKKDRALDSIDDDPLEPGEEAAR